MTPEESTSPDLDLVAAALRADLGDIAAFVEGLATRLELALPGLVQVKRTRTGLRGPRLVSEIAVEAGDERLQLRRERGLLQTVRARVSGGIVIRTEALDIDSWLAALVTAVAAQAQRSEQTRAALQQLVLDR
ncbi:MAG TPA: hypothetical protein VFN36_03405 [Solirubrobacteraceae bacterium]|nr:hypothetical protein [Solirubrobacteraceae bacterium]